jgi:tyrosine-protein phosphatase OCA1
LFAPNFIQHHPIMSLYMPPMNFGMVADDLYRSGAPNELNFPFLEKLHLKKIIFLAPDDPSQQL